MLSSILVSSEEERCPEHESDLGDQPSERDHGLLADGLHWQHQPLTPADLGGHRDILQILGAENRNTVQNIFSLVFHQHFLKSYTKPYLYPCGKSPS